MKLIFAIVILSSVLVLVSVNKFYSSENNSNNYCSNDTLLIQNKTDKISLLNQPITRNNKSTIDVSDYNLVTLDSLEQQVISKGTTKGKHIGKYIDPQIAYSEKNPKPTHLGIYIDPLDISPMSDVPQSSHHIGAYIDPEIID